MALLQISEPGMSTAPHQHRLAVGIDLGTTNSLVATVRNGVPQCLQDDDGKLLLPSIVHYLPDGQIVLLDELVQMPADEEEVLAILAHELGHVRHRHGLTQLIQSSVPVPEPQRLEFV